MLLSRDYGLANSYELVGHSLYYCEPIDGRTRGAWLAIGADILFYSSLSEVTHTTSSGSPVLMPLYISASDSVLAALPPIMSEALDWLATWDGSVE